MTDDRETFQLECRANAARMSQDTTLLELSQGWIEATSEHKYSYNFRWLGLPIIQLPQDVLMLQELIWGVRPDLIIETGVARGGGTIFYASMLELIGGTGRVMAIDVDIRPHNRSALEEHPLFHRIELVEGSSVDAEVTDRAAHAAQAAERVMVVLDSNHTHEHVLAELRGYGPLVTRDSYLVVFDTVIEKLPEETFRDQPWGRGDNAATAVRQYLSEQDRFEVDSEIDARLLISHAPGGYLRCVAGRSQDGR
jgi:cephalosporin hydroxylase